METKSYNLAKRRATNRTADTCPCPYLCQVQQREVGIVVYVRRGKDVVKARFPSEVRFGEEGFVVFVMARIIRSIDEVRAFK